VNRLRIPFIRPTIPAPEEWLPFLRPSYEAKRFSNFGPASRELEERLQARFAVGDRAFVLTSSATSGLAAMLLALNIRGRVVLPAFTFPATMRAVQMAGCIPALCDVDPITWEMSCKTLEPLLAQGRVGAVVPVRAFGLCRDHDPLVRRCAADGIPVIIDSAASFGGQIRPGNWAGSQGVAEVFSFHATKVFGIGEGGAICLDQSLAADVRSALNFGIAPKATGRGLNGKLSEFAAAIGLAVLDRFDDFMCHRRHLGARYIERLSRLGELILPSSVGDTVWQCFPVLLSDELDADEFVTLAMRQGVELRRYYHPALSLCGEQGSAGAPLDTSRELASSMVCLPVYSDMSLLEQDEIIKCVEETLSTLSRRGRLPSH
jgi:dTDP-4-amino-4,6-dideoxygalactose transaminase